MNNYLQHGWVSSKDPTVAAKQKQREKEYNAKYYQAHKKNRTPFSKTLTSQRNNAVNEAYEQSVLNRRRKKVKGASSISNGAYKKALSDIRRRNEAMLNKETAYDNAVDSRNSAVRKVTRASNERRKRQQALLGRQERNKATKLRNNAVNEAYENARKKSRSLKQQSYINRKNARESTMISNSILDRTKSLEKNKKYRKKYRKKIATKRKITNAKRNSLIKIGGLIANITSKNTNQSKKLSDKQKLDLTKRFLEQKKINMKNKYINYKSKHSR